MKTSFGNFVSLNNTNAKVFKTHSIFSIFASDIIKNNPKFFQK